MLTTSTSVIDRTCSDTARSLYSKSLYQSLYTTCYHFTVANASSPHTATSTTDCKRKVPLSGSNNICPQNALSQYLKRV